MSLTGDNHNHARWRGLLERHIDGDLAAPERMELFAHLEECEECQETLEAEERMIDRLSRIPKLTAPSDLRAAILREAVRERAEALQPLSEDARYAGLLRAADEADEIENGVAGAGTISEASAPPRRSDRTSGRKRRSATTWRRASPYLAMAFLAGSAGLSILSRQIPGTASDRMHGIATNLPFGAYVQELASVLSPRREAPVEETDTALMPVEPGPGDLGRSPVAHADHSSGAGTKVIIQPGAGDVGTDFRSRLTELTGIPVAAEQEHQVTETFVLRLTGADRNTKSRAQLADVLQHLLEDELGARIRQFEQSKRGNWCSSAFTVDLSPAACECLLNALRSHQVDSGPGADLSMFSGTPEAFLDLLQCHLEPEGFKSVTGAVQRARIILLEE